MNCRDFLARHSEYVDGVIEAVAAERMSAHARTCTSCARYDRVVRRGGVLVRQLPEIAPSPDFEARVRHRLFHVRDDLAQRRAGQAPVFIAIASVVLTIGAAAVGAFSIGRTPVVDAQVVFADAPRPEKTLEVAPSYTPLEAHIVMATAPLPASRERDRDPVSPIAAAARGHDAHLAPPVAWPVYSRDGAAAAFPKAAAELVVKPAEFRPASAVHTAGPILVRH